MAKLTDKSALTSPANDDLLYIVDVSDTTDSAQGTSKKIEVQNLVGSTIPQSYLDTDGTLAANSDTKIATQKATKTYADTKLTNSMTTNRLLGRTATGTGAIEEITIGSNLSLTSTTLSLGIAYETGTWTPTIQGTTTNGTATYTNQQGTYTRIGDLCFVTLWLNWSGGTGTGNLRIAGLPFTVDATYYSSLNVGWNINVALSANTIATCYANLNTTHLIMYTQTVGGGSAPNVAYDAAGNINISGVYKIA